MKGKGFCLEAAEEKEARQGRKEEVVEATTGKETALGGSKAVPSWWVAQDEFAKVGNGGR